MGRNDIICFPFSEMYKEFTAMLDHLYNQSISNPLTPSVPKQPGPPIQSSFEVRMKPAKEILHDIIEKALRTTCETLHSCVYFWMIEKNMNGELVALAAPSLENYLIRTKKPELLWQFYERNRKHAKAAKILNTLASKQGISMFLFIYVFCPGIVFYQTRIRYC